MPSRSMLTRSHPPAAPALLLVSCNLAHAGGLRNTQEKWTGQSGERAKRDKEGQDVTEASPPEGDDRRPQAWIVIDAHVVADSEQAPIPPVENPSEQGLAVETLDLGQE